MSPAAASAGTPHVSAWSAEHLLAMLADPDYEPPPLGLKCDLWRDPATGRLQAVPGTHKIEVRRLLGDDGETYVEKFKLGRLGNRVRYEADLLELVHKLPLLRDHVVGSPGRFERQGPAGPSLTMYWAGLSVSDWNVLLGAASPFRSSCVAVLALVRAVLRATDDFHAAGFVHCDLLLQNIVVQSMQMMGRNGIWRMNLTETRLIDLEFSLPPLQEVPDGNGCVRRVRKWFRDADGELIWLNPAAHSLQLMPGPVQKVGNNWYPVDRTQLHPDAQERLLRIDWGADFFSIACWVEDLTRTGNFVDEEDKPEVMRYLQALPAQLRSFDRPVDTAAGEAVPRPDRPHSRLMHQISQLIGAHDNAATLNFRLPTPEQARQRGPGSSMELSTAEPVGEGVARTSSPESRTSPKSWDGWSTPLSKHVLVLVLAVVIVASAVRIAKLVRPEPTPTVGAPTSASQSAPAPMAATVPVQVSPPSEAMPNATAAAAAQAAPAADAVREAAIRAGLQELARRDRSVGAAAAAGAAGADWRAYQVGRSQGAAAAATGAAAAAAAGAAADATEKAADAAAPKR